MCAQIRVGIPEVHAYGMEDLLYKYGVDIHLEAHEHSYERMWPVYNLQVFWQMAFSQLLLPVITLAQI